MIDEIIGEKLLVSDTLSRAHTRNTQTCGSPQHFHGAKMDEFEAPRDRSVNQRDSEITLKNLKRGKMCSHFYLAK